MSVLYEGDLQSERPINATRVKDQLYIFTGTYPLYYKGDGNLYLLPEHQTTYTEQVVSGHNTMMRNFDERYYKSFIEETIEPTDLDANNFNVKDFVFSPELIYTNNYEDDAPLQVKASFSISPDVLIKPDAETYDTDEVYIRAKGYQRAFIPFGVSQNVYQELDLSEFIPRFYFSPTSTGSFEYRIQNFNNPNFDPIIEQGSGSSEDQWVYFIGQFYNIPSGLRDFKVEFEIYRYSKNIGADEEAIETVLAKAIVELPEVTITFEKVEDYPTEEKPDRGIFKLAAPWTCNQVMEHYGQLLIWGSESMPNSLFISSNDNLNYFPSLYFFTFETDLNEPLTSVTPYMNILVVQSDSYTWGIKGTNPVRSLDRFGQEPNPNRYEVFSINSSVGSIAPHAVRPVRNRLYFLSQEGLMELTSLFATDDRYNVKPLDRNIRNLIPQDREAIAIQFDNQYWINFPSTGEMFRYYIDKQAWVKDTYNFNIFNGFKKFYNRDGKLHMITHPMRVGTTGDYSLYEVEVDDALALDLGQAIVSKFLTSKMNQEYPFHWKRYKEFKMDFSVQNEYLPTLESVPALFDYDSGTFTIEANFKPTHSYSVALDIDPTVSVNETTGEVTYSYPGLAGLNVTNVSSFSYADGVVYFTVGNQPPSVVSITYTNPSESVFSDPVLMDETYDKNLDFKIKIISDNNSLLRDVGVVTNEYSGVIPLVSEESGIMANTFEETFENSQFGKAYKFLHTNKLYGSGYDIEMYYEDASKVKWTLETLGTTYKMRRTRSR